MIYLTEVRAICSQQRRLVLGAAKMEALASSMPAICLQVKETSALQATCLWALLHTLRSGHIITSNTLPSQKMTHSITR